MRAWFELACGRRRLARCHVLMPLAASVLCACSSHDTEPGYFCTALFAYITVTAVDSAGQPVNDLAIRDSVLRTHQASDVTDQSLALLTPGTYVIFADNYMDSVRASGDSVRVTGTSSSVGPAPSPGFSTVYVFGNDGCHVKKLAGPDTVVAR